MKESRDLIILLTQDQGMVRIGGNPFDSKEKGVLKRKDIWINALIRF
jgi:hypothetical protein